jgi:hypothetical protein
MLILDLSCHSGIFMRMIGCDQLKDFELSFCLEQLGSVTRPSIYVANLFSL